MRPAKLADGQIQPKPEKEEKELDQQDVDSQKQLSRRDWLRELEVRVSCPCDLRLSVGDQVSRQK